MKRRLYFIVGLILMIVISVLFFYQRKTNVDEQQNIYRLTIEEKQLLQEGDIILRRGFGIISDAIVKYSKENLSISHCGIIVKDSANNLYVIHTVSNTLADIDGIQKDELNLFVRGSHPNTLIVTRYLYENDTMQKSIVYWANYYLSKQIPFDHQFNCEDSTRFFCTEFVRNVFKNAINVDLYKSSDGEEFDCMGFWALIDTRRFKLVLNHGSNN